MDRCPSMTKPSTWWNTGVWVASSSRRGRPGRGTRRRSAAVRAASSGPEPARCGRAAPSRTRRPHYCCRCRRDRRCRRCPAWRGPGGPARSSTRRSCTTRTPTRDRRAISQPMATKMSAISSMIVEIGCRAPARRRSYGRVTSTASSTSIRASRSASRTCSRAVRASETSRRATPTSRPAAPLGVLGQRADRSVGQRERGPLTDLRQPGGFEYLVEIVGLGDRGERGLGGSPHGGRVGRIQRVRGVLVIDAFRAGDQDEV